mgnify:CR=1 FL=1
MKYLIKNRLFNNIFSLVILQGSNYIFPLITFPFLVRKLGIENYGILTFSTALMQFLNIFVDYGFNISATKEISIHKYNIKRVNEIYNLIMTIKLIFTLLIGILIFILVEVVPVLEEHRLVYLVSFLIIVGNTLFPLWLFQGLERMKYITYINIFVKAIVTLLIIIFIKNDKDLTLAVLFQSFYYLIPGLISIYFVKRKFNVKFQLILNFQKIINELRSDKDIFMTNLWIKFYNQAPAIILGFLSGKSSTGNFGIGQKVQGAFSGLSLPFTQAIYPYLCELYKKNLLAFNIFKKRLLKYSILFSLFITLGLNFFSNQIIKFVTGEQNNNLVILIRLFSIIIFLGVMNTIMSRIMYAMDMQKLLNKSYSRAALSFFLVCFPLTISFNEYGMVLSIIVAEATVFYFNIKTVF